MQKQVSTFTTDPSSSPKLLSRPDTASVLQTAGFQVSASTLAKLAVSGGGPEFIKFGRQVLYEPERALNWARNRAFMHRSTSDQGTALQSQKNGALNARSIAEPTVDGEKHNTPLGCLQKVGSEPHAR